MPAEPDKANNISRPATDSGFMPNISKYVEPATILTLTIAAIYYAGWSYTDGFFHSVGLPHDLFELSTAQYTQRGFLAILIVSLMVLTVLQTTLLDISLPSRIHAFIINLGILTMAAFCIRYLYSSDHVAPRALAVIGGATLLLIALYATWQKKLLISNKAVQSPIKRAGLFLLAYFLVIVLAYEEGKDMGRRAMEGRLHDTPIIFFSWKEAAINELAQKDLVLILHKDEKYYVVEKTVPAPDNPKVYIIPEELIKHAMIRQINR